MTHSRRIACLAPLACCLGLAQSSGSVKVEPGPPQRASFAIAAGRLYEQLGEWEKAEERYLKAGEDLAPTIQRETLDAIARVRQASKEKKRHGALLAAKSLENQERWKDAEQAYVELLKSDPSAEAEVVKGLERLRPRLTGKRWTEAFDEDAGIAGRGILVVTIILVVWIAVRETKKTRRSIQFLPFRASSDYGAKQMAFWIGRVRTELRSPAMPVHLSSGLCSGLPFVRMPDLPEQVNEPAEFEVGGVKFPLKQLTQFVSIPRVRVSCAWMVGAVSGDAVAEVECRRRTESIPHSIVARSVASSPGAAQDRDLRLFAYDVFIKIGSAYERQ
jgi:hypothetical protein